MKEKEVRKINMQFRAESNDDGEMRIKGYAVVFDSPETYGYTEVIDKHALDETDMSDVVLRYNHNDSFMVLARTRNGSLKLDKDTKGLLMDAVLQNNITDHVNVYNAIDSELIDKQSFAFKKHLPTSAWRRWRPFPVSTPGPGRCPVHRQLPSGFFRRKTAG